MSPAEETSDTTAVPAATANASPNASDNEPLLDSKLMQKLGRWSLAVRRATSGQYTGERRSMRHGQSVEFADFRNYVPGDDLRFIDWNLYARTERLYLKLFLQEQELSVYILLDLSESMTFGDPPKERLARRLAAALGYLALSRGDALSIQAGAKTATGNPGEFRLTKGLGFARRMLWHLQNLQPGGAVSLAQFVNRSLRKIRRPGLVILISDFLGEENFEEALRPIVARRHEAIIIQLLDREEWDPQLRGDLKLVDSESDSPVEISATPALLKRYRNRVEAWCLSIEAYCARRGLTYVRIFNDTPLEDIVFRTLSRLGRVK